MPLYEYRCRNCNHQFEIQQSFSDDALTVCPECQGALRKVFNPVGISFRGSGFYKNDSRGSSSEGSTSSGGDGGGGSKEKESASSSSSDSSSSPDTSSGGGSKESATSSTSSGSGTSD